MLFVCAIERHKFGGGCEEHSECSRPGKEIRVVVEERSDNRRAKRSDQKEPLQPIGPEGNIGWHNKTLSDAAAQGFRASEITDSFNHAM